MRTTSTRGTSLIVAAQSGDRRALDELVTAHLPMVYTLVRRTLGRHPDVDDVVQEIMLRAVRRLRVLRDPDNFRPWLAAIAVRHIGTHLHREHRAAGRMVALDEVAEAPDGDADVEGVTLLRVELSAQRRQVVRASHWIDDDDRALLSLWWLEIAGQLTRTELAAALGVGVAHAGVRVQRMRHQIDVSRSVVAALDARPGCPGLHAVAAMWDGRPSPLWRKRIARHIRSCTLCARSAGGMVATERLLAGVGLLAVPAALAAAVIGKSAFAAAAAGATSAALSATGAGASGGAGAGVKVGLLSYLVQAVGAHPVAATVTAGALVVGTAVTATSWPPAVPPAPAVIAAPTSTPTAIARPTPTPVAGNPTAVPPPPAPDAGPSVTASAPPELGPVSLESANDPGRFVATAGDLGVLAIIDPAGDDAAGQRAATFEVVSGLADPDCVSFRTPDGRHLRHLSWRLRLSQDEGTLLFRGDATFCVQAGSVDGSLSLESSNYPGWYLRHRGGELWVDHSDGSATFLADSSFLVRPPLAG